MDTLVLVAHQQLHIDRGEAVEMEKTEDGGLQRIVILAADEPDWVERGWRRACR